MKLSFALALAALIGAGPAFADPPGHAPAHGYYKKAKHYKGKSGVSMSATTAFRPAAATATKSAR